MSTGEIAAGNPITLRGLPLLAAEEENEGCELMVAMGKAYGAMVRAVDSAGAAIRDTASCPRAG
jgi:hypothetical protein